MVRRRFAGAARSAGRTKDYFENEDTVQQFLDECTVFQAGLKRKDAVGQAALIAAFENWCNERGEPPMHPKRFKETLTAKNFTIFPSNTGTRAQAGALKQTPSGKQRRPS